MCLFSIHSPEILVSKLGFHYLRFDARKSILVANKTKNRNFQGDTNNYHKFLEKHVSIDSFEGKTVIDYPEFSVKHRLSNY